VKDHASHPDTQDRQRTDNATWRRVGVAIMTVEEQKALHILSIFIYPAPKAHVPYFYLWPV